MRLSDKVALVTGASGGIGHAIAARFAEEGAHVAVHYSSNEKPARELVEQIRSQGRKAEAFQADLAEVDAVTKLVHNVHSAFGRLDILVNNAGIPASGEVTSFTPEQYQQAFDVNVRAVFFAVQAAVPLMPDHGRIINISSGMVKRPSARGSIYAATKAAVDSFTQSFAHAFAERRITVNAIQPGPTLPGMFGRHSKERQDAYAKQSLIGRLGKAEEIAALAAFLASDEGALITGQVITADGGVFS
ncbi:MAG: 3-oxoacyl-acyl-carrier protein reductase [Puniceicoccaceae bacterium 5H]|nr:MAG: 3-oxoacyl-acyl-carrier protein reductase [Puniceicoccaceae bacterium 5H]